MKESTPTKTTILVLLLSVLPLTARAQKLSEIYAKGRIQLKNEEGYGEKTDWTALFYNTFTDILTAPDGSVFAASSRQHTIFKFDKEGNLIKSIGQKGQGTGDFNGPDSLSLLDGKYLVVGEYALGHRISLFDLEGDFVKLLKTDMAAYYPTAMGNDTIAYVGIQHREKEGVTVKIDNVRIKDVETGREETLCSFTYPVQSIMLQRGSFSFGDNTAGRTHIARGGDDTLIVGNSMEPELRIYDIEGRQTATIPLALEPVPVTRQFIKEYKKEKLEELQQESDTDRRNMEMVKSLQKADISHLFGNHLPFYKELLVDREGNILIFVPGTCLGGCPIVFRAYSGSGRFLGETEITSGDHVLIVDPRRKHMQFDSKGLYALVQPKDSNDFMLRLIKVVF